MANPISRQAEDKRESGFQRTGELGTDGGALDTTIQAHNRQLIERAGGLFELPLVVLTEQRDDALRRLANARERAAEQRRRLVAEQDKFITILMTEHEAKLRGLGDECERLRAALAATLHARHPETNSAPSQQNALQQALDAANAEVDETRADALRLQEERDDAIRANDDLRLELMSQLESARDEAFQLETRLDEVNRLLEDTKDEKRDETLRLSEELGEVRREFAACNDELRRLRARLSSSVRPPPLPKSHQA